MFMWIADNMATIIIACVLVLIVAAIVIHLVNNKKEGKSSCGCKCGSCPMSSSCHKQ